METILEPCGFVVEHISRVPYLSQGSDSREYWIYIYDERKCDVPYLSPSKLQSNVLEQSTNSFPMRLCTFWNQPQTCVFLLIRERKKTQQCSKSALSVQFDYESGMGGEGWWGRISFVVASTVQFFFSRASRSWLVSFCYSKYFDSSRVSYPKFSSRRCFSPFFVSSLRANECRYGSFVVTPSWFFVQFFVSVYSGKFDK